MEIVKKLIHDYGKSFYVFDLEKLRKNYSSMLDAFTKRYEKFIVGYSYKTNYLPKLLKEMSHLGAFAEVVSRIEYDLALKIGVDPEKIIFNGPLKSNDDLIMALDNGSMINLDSFYEIDLIKEYVKRHDQRQFKVGLRVNFDMSIDGESPLQGGFQQSRFGFCVENGNLLKAINEIKQFTNVSIVGLQGHFSTQIRSLDVYKKITQTLCDLAKEHLSESIEYLDVGGGFYGNVPKEMNLSNIPTFDDYANTICSIMNKEKGNFKKVPFLIVEPGLALVVDTFTFFTEVIDVKKNQNDYFVLVHGSVHNIKPSLSKKNTAVEHIKLKSDHYEKNRFHVVGYTCMEKDYLLIDYEGDLPKVGDCLLFKNVGAYTIVLNPPFIKERPPIIIQEGSKFVFGRKRETLDEFINSELYIY